MSGCASALSDSSMIAIRDPVALGLVSSLARPGNITGVSDLEIWGKRVGLLRELIPAASRVGRSRDAEWVTIPEAAQQAGITLVASQPYQAAPDGRQHVSLDLASDLA